MVESYVEGLATCNGPESCGTGREDDTEALTGVRAGGYQAAKESFGVPTL